MQIMPEVVYLAIAPKVLLSIAFNTLCLLQNCSFHWKLLCVLFVIEPIHIVKASSLLQNRRGAYTIRAELSRYLIQKPV